MVLCAVCKQVEATQKHHVAYEPELLIDVCVQCHKTIHNHGVGNGSEYYHPIEEARKLWYDNKDKVVEALRIMSFNLCLRCGHSWPSRRKTIGQPKICPKCKSKLWNVSKS